MIYVQYDTKLMKYVPTFRLFFPSGVYNDYRIWNGRVEFSSNENEWRELDDSDIELHFRFKTPVSKWLREHNVTVRHLGIRDSKRKTRKQANRIVPAER